MLLFELNDIGNKLYLARKERGMTQAEAAEAAGLSDRTYGDIERGKTNMRIETFIKICDAFRVLPNEVLMEEAELDNLEPVVKEGFMRCTESEKKMVLRLIVFYMKMSNIL